MRVPSASVWAEIRGESAAAPRFQSTDIPHELSLSLQEPAACSLKRFLPSLPASLPTRIVVSKVEPPSHYFFLLDAESRPVKHHIINIASCNAVYRGAIREETPAFEKLLLLSAENGRF